ncbi:Phosphatidylinositol/phosphatidylcholine transfer protein SFH12 [Forsythia ovata]|uniref:Phosphatidylinositol/phosphatidylcholine transfer protein SFH12 n=1 Tax=Forsythia ovata TaxID=205694 RepID=A0ABD1RNG8_9LAMI
MTSYEISIQSKVIRVCLFIQNLCSFNPNLYQEDNDRFPKEESSECIIKVQAFSQEERRSSQLCFNWDIWDVEELQAVESFRQDFILDELLPEKLEDYHIMLRLLFFFSSYL